MIFLPPDLEKYIEDHSLKLPSVLDEIERETYWKTPYPQMLSGKIQASFLHFMVKMIRPRRILEIGTFTGYTAVAMASAMPPQCVLDTVEIHETTASMARNFFSRTPWKNRIRLHVESASEFLKKAKGPYDFIFLDADKENYPLYYDLLKPLLSSDGLWITDNVLWNGKVLQPRDAASRAIDAFNRKAAEDPETEQMILPIRDGLMLLRKITDGKHQKEA